MVVKMSIRLTWRTVRGSPLWVVNFIRLILYALFCAPALAVQRHGSSNNSQKGGQTDARRIAVVGEEWLDSVA